MLTNLNNLKDTLSGMDLQGLQNYARVNKNDPYIVSMALSMANTLKKMEVAKKGRAGMQPQPKVVDQQIAQMVAPPPQQMAAAPQQQALPEDSGIGQLPAQNMQRMAGGGIVAFEEGGDVPGYAGGVYTGEEVPSGAIIMGNMYQDPVTGQMKPLPQRDALPFGNVPINYAENKRLYLEKQKADLANRKAAAEAIINESPEDYALRKVTELEAQGGKKLSPDARNMAMSGFVKEKMAGQVGRGEASYTKDSQLPTPATTYTGAKPLPGMTPPGQSPLSALTKPPGAPGAVSPEDEHMSGINKLIGSIQTASRMGPMTPLDAKKYSYTPAEFANMTPEFFADAVTKAMGKDPAKDPFGGQTEELTKTAVAAKQNYKADLEKQFKEQGLAFEGTLKKLTEKEGRINTMEERNTGMALLEAGLSMMSGESPHALVNIGKGAQVGAKKYSEGMAQIEAARDKLDDARMKIEEFRRNEANMNAREARAAQKDIDDTIHQGAVLKLAGMRDAFNMNKQQAIASVTNYAQIQQFNIGEKNKAAAQNQSTAAGIDTAYAQMANQERINARSNAMHLGLAKLEAQYKKDNPAAGSLGFYKQLANNPEAVKGMKLFSENLGPEGKGSEAILLDWQKKNPFEKQQARKADPVGSAMLDRQLRERVLQGSISDAPAGKLLDKQ